MPQRAVAADTTAPFPPKLGGAEIRERFLQFFEKNHHTRLPSSSLIPEDTTVLLTIAGMLQFKSIFMGQVGLLQAFYALHDSSTVWHMILCIAGPKKA